MHGQELCNAWIRKVPDATVIDEVEAFAKDWGWQIDERADADASASGLCKGRGGKSVSVFDGNVCPRVSALRKALKS